MVCQTQPSGSPTTASRLRWWALLVMCSTVLLISLDQTVLNVALPTLVEDLHPTSGALQWIADAYTLANAVLLLLGGALGDRFGRRRIFLTGVLVFGGGSLACSQVHTAGALIATRALTGAGAALLMPATLSIITSMFAGTERARAIGLWAGVGGIGTAAGPLLGGWLLQHFWWGSVFLINVPIAAVALVGGLTVVPESRADRQPRLDLVGVVLSAAGLTALTYGLIVAPADGWGSATVVGSFVAAAVLLVVFLLWDRRRDSPLLDIHLFANRTFSSALGGVTAVFFAMFGVSFLLSQYIQFVQGADPLGVGLRFLPMAVGTLIGSNGAPRVAARIGLRATMLAGMLGVTAGLAIFATVTTTTGVVPVAVAFGCIGLGMGLVVAPASNAIMSSLPPAKIGAGSGLRSMVQLLGGSFGVAVIGSLAVGRYHAEMTQALSGPLHAVPPVAHPAVSSQIGQAVAVSGQLPAPLAHQVTAAAGNAFVSGMHLSAIVGVVVMVVAMAAAAIYIPRQGAQSAEEVHHHAGVV